VESEVGVGSTFTFTLPVQQVSLAVSDGEFEAAPQAQPTPAEERAEPKVHANKGDASRPLILIVEDNRSSADLLRLTLGDEGFALVVAHDGEEGLDMARRFHPAAIVLDVLLPGLDGWEFLTRVKADSTLSSIPVIVVSILQERTKAMALGAADYLIKPVNREDLIATVRSRVAPVPVGWGG
jgi:CheY-like chemotaxis protein